MGASLQSREVLLTGATGFLGKVVLEKLLRRREELGIARIHVVVRPKRDQSAEERFHTKLLASPCFSDLPCGWQRAVSAVAAELRHPNCGMEREVREDLAPRVTHIIHCAASVDFDLPLEEAAAANIASSLNLLDFAKTCPRLASMVAVSTAYVTPFRPDGSPIEEKLVDLPLPAETIYAEISRGNVNAKELLAMTGHPNTYTLTKCIAEHLLTTRRGNVPLSLVRPSIISASWRYPFPGWIDSHAAFAGFVSLIGSGYLRAVVGRPSAQVDIVPCDEVAARVLNSAFTNPPAPGAPVAIRHAVLGAERSYRGDYLGRVITEVFNRHPIARTPQVLHYGPKNARFRRLDWLHHRWPTALAMFWYGVSGRRERRRHAAELLSRLTYINKAFPYFTHHTFNFHTSVPLTDPDFDSMTYVRTACRGVYRYLLRGDESEISVGGRRHRNGASDLRWVLRQPNGDALLRTAAYIVTKLLRRCCERVTVDLTSFETALESTSDDHLLVIAPSHRSYLDFVLCSYLFFARPDLGIPVPHIAAAEEFSRILVLGRLLKHFRAFYVKRGQGREDKNLTRQIHELAASGATLEFFIEGTRSRSRRFLPPRRGLLRSLQATARPCTLLPLAISYDRVPEERALARELRGGPKPGMQLSSLLIWIAKLALGRVRLGRIHVACGKPLVLNLMSDVHALSQEIMGESQSQTVTTTHHLRAFLAREKTAAIDLEWLRGAIERRGGRVLQSGLSDENRIDPVVERCLRYQWLHLFYADVRALYPSHPALEHHMRSNDYAGSARRDVEADAATDPRLLIFLRRAFQPICDTYAAVTEALGEPHKPLRVRSQRELLQQLPPLCAPFLDAAVGALCEAGILRRNEGNGELAWGPHANALPAYRAACRYPDADEGTAVLERFAV